MSDSRRDRTRAWLAGVSAKDILVGLLAILAALGFTVNTPGKKLDALDVRVTHSERRIDTLAEAQRFTNYMLCVNARRTDPASAPTDCTPIIEARRGK